MFAPSLRRFIAIALLTTVQPAAAQNVGTTETQAYSSTQDGKRVGCMIEFQTVVQDYTYRQGGPVIVSGSMGLMRYPGKQPAITLKVVLSDVSVDGAAIMGDLMPPASISLVGLDDESTAKDQIMSAPGELPNSRIAAFSIDHFLPVLKRIAERKELAILFNRKNGGTDVRALVDLSVERLDHSGKQLRGTQTIAGFLACSEKLLGDASEPSRIR